MSTAEDWLEKLSRLKVDRATGDPAPHKPLLLLVVLDLTRDSALPDDILRLTPELVFRFSAYWPIVAHRRSRAPDVRLPLLYLRSDGIWSAFAADGRPSSHERDTSYVRLNAEFQSLLADSAWCSAARRTLIATYFQPLEQLALYEFQGMEPPSGPDAILAPSPALSDSREKGREARFRVEVVSSYGYRCALTGYRLMTISAGTIVDAAHIHAFSSSRNNDIQNGLALSKNAHWMFDHGLWTATDDYRVKVATGQFTEAGPDAMLLAQYDGRLLHLPTDPAKQPGCDYLRWHRNNAFAGDPGP